jgi:hypothetical protein
MRKGELPLGEETQKMGEQTPSLKFNPLSNSQRGHPRCGMGPPCGPHHQMANPMEMVSPTRDKFAPLSKFKLYGGWERGNLIYLTSYYI